MIPGEAGDDEIDAELRETTPRPASGTRNLFVQRARPRRRRTGKRGIPRLTTSRWQITAGGDHRRNHDRRTTRAVTTTRVGQYFDAIPSTWQRRTPEMAQQIVSGLYPICFVEPATITLDRGLPPRPSRPANGAKRLVAEALDGVMRAMRCQERDPPGRDQSGKSVWSTRNDRAWSPSTTMPSRSPGRDVTNREARGHRQGRESARLIIKVSRTRHR